MTSDNNIVQFLRAGNEDAALQLLYTSTLKKVRRMITKKGGTKEEADDIFQDTVITFFEKVKSRQIETRDDVEGYIITIAKNLWIDSIRRKKRHQQFEEINRAEKREYTNQLSELINKEKETAMTTLFSLLGEKCQQIMTLSFYERMTMKEISKKLEYKNEDVTKALHYRCKKSLAKLAQENPTLVQTLR